MSGELAVRGAILSALRGDAALMAMVNQVSDGEPVKASAPWLMLGDAMASGWGARGVDGLALRQTLLLVLRGDELGRVADILTRVDDALTGIDSALGDWRLTSLRFERSRIVRSRTEWRASIDYAVRMARLS
ncbi:DUF3168 domain-containing protein [Sphingobium nicotianae]|uniref:DUF3168 domain-containing protein n=1 Tax=Sphingobium nicotianae TaxID=2782607 RepID=A0A9X1DBZ6_9SPHN|nr:DUF3168 domain-containing protein [Sphingobium nicotianae]MBT2186858.1 DUF3168 domain-containing protein [Sphingobium nicotianae]